MIDPSNNTTFGETLAAFGQINCVYAVYADGCLMYQSEVFTEALKEFRKWVMQLNAALPSMGDKVRLEVLL